MKYILIFMFSFTFLFAKVDYSAMSTEELFAMIGYVKKENKKDFVKELEMRFPKMSEKEKKVYIKNLDKIKK